MERLEAFPTYYNDQRPHQGRACQNQPPSVAFPTLPRLPQLPDEVSPDRWLEAAHGRVYRRRVTSDGTIQVDRHTYAIGSAYAKQMVLVHLDAHQRCFHVTLEGKPLKQLPIRGLHGPSMAFWPYFRLICAEARTVELHHRLLWERRSKLP